MTYVPPTFRRYLGITDDPHSPSGSNADTVLAAASPFTGGHIPDITNVWPVVDYDFDWGNTDLDYSNLVTGVRPAPVLLPLGVLPKLTINAYAHRYVIERSAKLVMGAEGSITGTGPYVHPISGVPMGASQLPTAMAQILRDASNIKMSGLVFESVQMAFTPTGAGTVAIEAHPLYAEIIDDHASPTVPTGVQAEPNVRPMLLRDLSVIFDGGSVEVGISGFRFGYQNNNTYAGREVAGLCVVSKTLNGAGYKLWFPNYHRVTGRPKGTVGFDLIDPSVAHELRQVWRQVTAVVATLVDPTGTTDQVVFTLPASVFDVGGVGAGAATGDLPATFNGSFYYDPTSGTDATVTVTNGRATPIAVI